MSDADRPFFLKRALLRALADCRSYPVLEAALLEAAKIKVDFLRPTTAEFDATLRAIDLARLAVTYESERGRILKLTDAGTLWLVEHP